MKFSKFFKNPCIKFFIVLFFLFLNDKSYSIPLMTNSDSTIRTIRVLVASNMTLNPISGVQIKVNGLDKVYYTKHDGIVEVPVNLDNGSISVSINGYEEQEQGYKVDDWRLFFRLEKNLSDVEFLLPGDTIPNYLWDLPVQIYDKNGAKSFTLREYVKDRPLVMYFWAKWCAPCLETARLWEQVQNLYPNKLAVVTVFMDIQNNAVKYLDKQPMALPVLVGETNDLVNRHFFQKSFVGSTVLIRDNKLYAIPIEGALDLFKLDRFIKGANVSYLHQTTLTYSENDKLKRRSR